MVNYPTSLDDNASLYLVEDAIDDVRDFHHNALKDALIAVETKVGITGSENFVLTTGDTMTGPLAINPSGTGNQNIISITPSAVLSSAGVTWRGLYVDGGALDPSASNIDVRGLEINFGGISITENTAVFGVRVIMHGTYSSGDEYAGHFAGDGKLVKICDGDYALYIDIGDAMLDGNLLMSGAGSDDKRLTVPYLTQAPSTLTNGSVWMESDGLHIYYNSAEKVVAGV